MLGQGKTCQKIGRRAGGSVDVSTEGFEPWIQASDQEETILCQGYWSYGVNWLIGQQAAREDDARKNRTKRRETHDMPDNLINCLGLIVSIEVFIFVCAGLTTMKVRQAAGVAPESSS